MQVSDKNLSLYLAVSFLSFALIILFAVSIMFMIGLREKDKFSERDLARNSRWIREIGLRCPMIGTQETENSLRSCESSTEECQTAFSRIEQLLLKLVTQGADRNCIEVSAEYYGESFELVAARIDGVESSSPIMLGWRKLRKVLDKTKTNTNQRIPTANEVDQEFRRIQKAIGAPETGAPAPAIEPQHNSNTFNAVEGLDNPL